MKTIARNCNYCQVEYQAEARYLNRGQGLFCSQKCSSLDFQSRRSLPNPNTSCAWCQKEIYLAPVRKSKSKSGLHFCSKAHQSLAFADPSIPVSPGPSRTTGNRSPKKCSRCARRHNGRIDDGFCQDCRFENKINLWLSGDNSIASGKHGVIKPWVKKYLLKIRGDKCETCGFVTPDKWLKEFGTIIALDHIDGHYDNNLVENLRLLCPNCHAMTKTFGSRNSGNGRRFRKKYYSQ